MPDLYAITGRVSTPAVNRIMRHKHSRQCRRTGLFISIGDDKPVDAMFFDDQELTLICSADLHAFSCVGDIATCLAQLYRQQGDGFVCDLRGSFAILLYDHRSQTLKAWSDHFGVERMAFAEIGDSLAVSTR